MAMALIAYVQDGPKVQYDAQAIVMFSAVFSLEISQRW